MPMQKNCWAYNFAQYPDTPVSRFWPIQQKILPWHTFPRLIKRSAPFDCSADGCFAGGLLVSTASARIMTGKNLSKVIPDEGITVGIVLGVTMR